MAKKKLEIKKSLKTDVSVEWDPASDLYKVKCGSQFLIVTVSELAEIEREIYLQLREMRTEEVTK